MRWPAFGPGAALVVACAVAGCGGGGANRSASDRAPTVVGVAAGDGAARDVATGMVVGDGRVLTVAHALPHGAAVRISLPGRRGALAARVLRRDDRLDLAVLAV